MSSTTNPTTTSCCAPSSVADRVSRGLIPDLLLRPPHLNAAIRLVDEFKDQRFVLDHIAKPQVGDVSGSIWKEDILRLAERPNVFCKLSGLVTEPIGARGVPTTSVRPSMSLRAGAID
jgi:L-fuconolactonase